MRDSLFLAWQYLRHYRLTTAALVAAMTLIIYLPAALQVIVLSAEQHFRSRSSSTPLLVGPRGSALELVLASLYFDKPCDDVMRFAELRRIEAQQFAEVIPLHVRFTARDSMIVGTSIRYLESRKLQLAHGRKWDLLGECVIGAGVAKRNGLEVGDRLPVAKSSALVLDDPPLRLHVVGVLATAETPDDEAIFVDIETTWIIEGLGHGHAARAPHGSPDAQLFTDITSENVESFHFHGDRDEFPLSAAIVMPDSEKSTTLLLGQYFDPNESVQILQPEEVMDSLLSKILMVRSYLVATIALLSVVTLLMAALIVVLSVRLRRAELVTMSKIGCSRFKIAEILGTQIAVILAASLSLAGMLTLATSYFGAEIMRMVLL